MVPTGHWRHCLTGMARGGSASSPPHVIQLRPSTSNFKSNACTLRRTAVSHPRQVTRMTLPRTDLTCSKWPNDGGAVFDLCHTRCKVVSTNLDRRRDLIVVYRIRLWRYSPSANAPAWICAVISIVLAGANAFTFADIA